jgi:conjugal transfer/entry exclusion protein
LHTVSETNSADLQQPIRFESTHSSYWNDLNNQRQFLDWAAQQLNVNSPSDWYTVTLKASNILTQVTNLIKDLQEIGGKTLLRTKYNNSKSLLLSTVYSEYNWSFEKSDLDNIQNQRQILDSIAQKLQIKEFSDWYQVSKKVGNVFAVSHFFSNLKILEQLQIFC